MTPSPVPGWVRIVRRVVWAMFTVGFVALYAVSRVGPAGRHAVLAYLGSLAVSVAGLLGVALLEGWLWLRRRSHLRRALSDGPSDDSAGVCDWCGGPAGAASLREGELLFCGPACRAAHAAPRQSIHTAPEDGWRSRARRPLRPTAEGAPFLREGLDAIDRGLARLFELAPSAVRSMLDDVASRVRPLAILDASAEFSGGVVESARWLVVLDETESAVRWAFERAGQPDPLAFNDVFGCYVDLHRIRTCVANDVPLEELGQALLEAQRAAFLLRAEIEAALSRL